MFKTRKSYYYSVSNSLFLLVAGVILCFLPIRVFSQDTLNRTDEAKLKQGYWKIYNTPKKLKAYKENQLIEEGPYLNNKKHGVWKQYYETGSIKSEITYKNNIPFGYAKFYHRNGKISEEGNWENYKWNGQYKYYYESGQLRYDWKFVNGVRESTQKYYYENGNLNFEGEWKNGGEYGIVKEYNEDGTLREERSYDNGKYEKDESKIYASQDAATPASFTKEKPIKPEGKNIGIFNGSGNNILYTSSGKISKEGYFMKGVLMNGKSYEYSPEGVLIKTKVYKNGKVVQNIEK